MLRNELQTYRSESQLLKNESQTLRNELKILRNKLQILRNKLQALRSESQKTNESLQTNKSQQTNKSHLYVKNQQQEMINMIKTIFNEFEYKTFDAVFVHDDTIILQLEQIFVKSH